MGLLPSYWGAATARRGGRHYGVPETTPSVPVLHETAPGPVTARLLVGVGTCDEPVRLAGITHLVEHLSVRGALPLVAPHNAVTDDWVTVFEVTAPTTDGALDGLCRIASSIGDLAHVSDEDVERERKILAAEDRLRYSEQVPSIHTVRFGPTGPGRSGAGAAATHGLTAAEVRDWAQRWFVADNAVVTVVGGSAPAGRLAVRMPSGHAAGPVPRWDGPTDGGVLHGSGLGGVAASVVVPSGSALLLEAVLEHEVFDDLRIGAALSYAVDSHTVDVDAERAAVGVVVDPAADDVVATIELLTSTLRRVAEQGPAATTIARIDAARALNDMDATVRADHALSVTALQRLRGLRSPMPDGPVTDREQADLRASLRAALPGLVICVDDDLEVELVDVAARVGLRHVEPSIGRPIDEVEPTPPSTRGTTYRDAFVPAWAGMRVQVQGSSLVLRPRGEVARVIDLMTAAVIGVRGDEGVTVVDAAGGLFQIRTAEWWRGARLVEAVRTAAPADVVRQYST